LTSIWRDDYSPCPSADIFGSGFDHFGNRGSPL
jgi:hypothetical protein